MIEGLRTFPSPARSAVLQYSNQMVAAAATIAGRQPDPSNLAGDFVAQMQQRVFDRSV
jgi:hypothetical protein